VFVWRGVWNLIDLYFIPQTHPLITNILGIGFGVAILAVTHKLINQLAGE
jgi:hypothetical protein